ncbi:MAG: GvpL/GvpF family gas vesicle protein [Chloroflexi bacterium]|nr:GvpL/GvpF family gas vesicle protein [Chloroflexota bacterium]
MTQPGRYLYCIIRCSEERAFEGVAPIGGADAAVYTVPHGALAMVVSDSATREYEATRANMLAHERVQERVLREFTLLPVRFGTVANSTAPVHEIQRLLEKRSPEFDRLLLEMEGKVELGIKALWRNEKVIFEEVLAENPRLRRLRNSLMGKPPEVVRREGVPLGEGVKAALEQKKSAEAATIVAPLGRIARRVQADQTTVDRMIVNTAFLVDQERQEEFDRQVALLDTELGPRVLFKYVGPVPPYNFVNIVVNWDEV